LAMGRARCLERRLVAILDAGRDRRPPSRAWRRLLLAAMATLVAPLASVRFQLPAATVEVTTAAAADEPTKDPAAPPTSLTEIREKGKKAYVGDLDDTTRVDGAIKGMLEALHDPYTDYLDAAKLHE